MQKQIENLENLEFCAKNHTLLPDESSNLSLSGYHQTGYAQNNDYRDHSSDKNIINIYTNDRSMDNDLSSPQCSYSPHLLPSPGNHQAGHSKVNNSEAYHFSDVGASNIYNNHSPTRQEQKDGSISEFHSNTDDNEQKLENSDGATKVKAIYSKDKSYSLESPSASYHQTKSTLKNNEIDMSEQYRQLYVLCETRGEELKRVQNENIRFRNEIKSLQSTLSYIESEQERLYSSLKESQNLSFEYHENILLNRKLAAAEVKFSAAEAAKEDALSKLQSAEITIQSSDEEMTLARSENAVRLCDQNENIMKELKLRHKKEVLQLKEEIDKLRENLDSKITESENMQSKIYQLQHKLKQSQVVKIEIIKKLSASFDDSQEGCQSLLESGSITENSYFQRKYQELEERRSGIQKHISYLKTFLQS